MKLPSVITWIAERASTEEEITAVRDYSAGFMLGSMDHVPEEAGPWNPLHYSEDFWRGWFDARGTMEWHRFINRNGKPEEYPRVRLKAPPILLSAFVDYLLNADFHDDPLGKIMTPVEREKLKTGAAKGDLWIDRVPAQRIADLLYPGHEPVLLKNQMLANEFAQWQLPDSMQTYHRNTAQTVDVYLKTIDKEAREAETDAMIAASEGRLRRPDVIPTVVKASRRAAIVIPRNPASVKPKPTVVISTKPAVDPAYDYDPDPEPAPDKPSDALLNLIKEKLKSKKEPNEPSAITTSSKTPACVPNADTGNALTSETLREDYQQPDAATIEEAEIRTDADGGDIRDPDRHNLRSTGGAGVDANDPRQNGAVRKSNDPGQSVRPGDGNVLVKARKKIPAGLEKAAGAILAWAEGDVTRSEAAHAVFAWENLRATGRYTVSGALSALRMARTQGVEELQGLDPKKFIYAQDLPMVDFTRRWQKALIDLNPQHRDAIRGLIKAANKRK